MRLLPVARVLLLVLAGCRLVAVGGESAGGFSFVVFGDNQCATASATSGVPERRAVPAVITGLSPDLVLHTGDLMDHGYDAEAYVRFAEYYADLLGAAPFFPTMGNHDAGRGGILNYRAFLAGLFAEGNPRAGGAAFMRDFELWFDDDPAAYPTRFGDAGSAAYKPDLPSGVSFKTFYAFRYRNALFISMEQGTRWWANTPRSWLEKHLRAARESGTIDHIFVTMHHPMYSTTMRESPPDPAKPGSGECIGPVRSLYEPLFRQYDVTIVFSGHAHLYDCFYVPDDDGATRSEVLPSGYPGDGSGVHYIVTGGGGGPLNPGGWCRERSFEYHRTRLCDYHVTQVDIDGPRATVSVHRVSGTGDAPASEVFDRFTIGAPHGAE